MPRPEAYGGLPQSLGKKDGDFLLEDLDFRIYQLTNRANASTLKECIRSGSHAQQAKLWPKQTQSLQFGTLVHRMLEVPEWRSECAMMPAFNARKKADREAKEKWLSEHEEKIVVTSEQLNALLRIEHNVKSHPVIEAMMEGARHETSGFWDGQFGIKCKFRSDVLTSDNVIVDWKTCQDATKFVYDAKRFKYDMQAAFYLEGLSAITNTHQQDFIFVAIENVAPFGVIVYHLDQETLNKGKRKVENAMRVYHMNHERESWEGYDHEIRALVF